MTHQSSNPNVSLKYYRPQPGNNKIMLIKVSRPNLSEYWCVRPVFRINTIMPHWRAGTGLRQYTLIHSYTQNYYYFTQGHNMFVYFSKLFFHVSPKFFYLLYISCDKS